MPLNRQTRRELAHNGKLEKYMNDVYEREHEKTRKFAYDNAWTSMMLALYERFHFSADMLYSIAVDTLEHCNGGEVPSEMAAKLLELSGWDYYEKPSESRLNYIEKGGDANSAEPVDLCP